MRHRRWSTDVKASSSLLSLRTESRPVRAPVCECGHSVLMWVTVSQRGQIDRKEVRCYHCEPSCYCVQPRRFLVSVLHPCMTISAPEVTMPLVRLYLRTVSQGGPHPPQTHWANDQPWQLKPVCESARHQEAHLLPALSHSHRPARPLAWVTPGS